MKKPVKNILTQAFNLYEIDRISEKLGVHINLGCVADSLLHDCLTILGVDQEIGCGIYVRDMFVDPIYESLNNNNPTIENFMSAVQECVDMFNKYKNSPEYHGKH